MSMYSPFEELEFDYIYGSDEPPIRREEYVEATLGDWEAAQRWFACGFNPEDVRRFIDMGFTPEQAQSWGLNPAMVERFRALGFTKEEAREWALAGIWPDHAVHWRRRGIAVQLARYVINRSASATAALAWTLVDASVSDIHAYVMHGDKPGQILAEQAPRAQPPRCDVSPVGDRSPRSCREAHKTQPKRPGQQKSKQ